MKLLRTIQLDASDSFVFEKAAAPGERAVSGAFSFARDEPARWEVSMRGLSSFWKSSARKMRRMNTLILPGSGKEQARECIARLLALLRASFARSRRHRQVACH